MKLFVTGSSGWIGSAVTDELIAHGHQVVGLARSDESAAALEAKGAGVRRGALDDLDGLAAGAAESDGVIHLAFNHDFSDYAGAGRTERAAVERMLGELEGSDRPFLFASGLVPGRDGTPLREEDASPFHGPDAMRGGSENLALSYADRGVRPVALRFSPTVHGVGDHGFTARLVQIAREAGTSGYIGEGTTRWAAVNRADAAEMVRLACEKAPAGSRMHAVAETGIASREIAEAIGERLGVPADSVPQDQAQARFGWLAMLYGSDMAAESATTRETLGWTPSRPTLLEDIAGDAYVRD